LQLAAAQCGKAQPFRAWVFIFTEAEPQEELLRAGRKAIGFPHCAAASPKTLLSAAGLIFHTRRSPQEEKMRIVSLFLLR
jgi:hypothetical protein